MYVVFYVILLLALILAFIFISYVFKLRLTPSNEIQILQTQNFDENNIQKMLVRKQPTIFKEIMYEWEVIDDIHDLTIEEINELKTLKQLVNNYLGLFSLFISPRWNIKIKYNNASYKNDYFMKVDRYHRFLVCQITGVSRIYLASPNQENNICIGKAPGFDILGNEIVKSNVNFWNENETSKEPFNRLEYVEILLKEASILYIPKGWWYLIKTEKEGLVMGASNESFFNIF